MTETKVTPTKQVQEYTMDASKLPSQPLSIFGLSHQICCPDGRRCAFCRAVLTVFFFLLLASIPPLVDNSFPIPPNTLHELSRYEFWLCDYYCIWSGYQNGWWCCEETDCFDHKFIEVFETHSSLKWIFVIKLNDL